jgi:hypothetical protein
VLALEEGAFDYVDVMGEKLAGKWRLAPRGTVQGGQWIEPLPRAA